LTEYLQEKIEIGTFEYVQFWIFTNFPRSALPIGSKTRLRSLLIDLGTGRTTIAESRVNLLLFQNPARFFQCLAYIHQPKG